jgi:hypothetical protein
MYLSDLPDKVDKKYGVNLSIKEVEESIDQLSWLGLVDYTARYGPIPMRLVRKVVP